MSKPSHPYNPRCLCTPCLDRTVAEAERKLNAWLCSPEGQAAAEAQQREVFGDE